MPQKQQQANAQQMQNPALLAAQGPELAHQQEMGNAAALQDAEIAPQEKPNDGKLRQAHGDHARLREEALVAQEKLSAGIHAISAHLTEGGKLAKPLCDPAKIKGIERSNVPNTPETRSVSHPSTTADQGERTRAGPRFGAP